jgi:hypothetical protein
VELDSRCSHTSHARANQGAPCLHTAPTFTTTFHFHSPRFVDTQFQARNSPSTLSLQTRSLLLPPPWDFLRSVQTLNPFQKNLLRICSNPYALSHHRLRGTVVLECTRRFLLPALIFCNNLTSYSGGYSPYMQQQQMDPQAAAYAQYMQQVTRDV